MVAPVTSVPLTPVNTMNVMDSRTVIRRQRRPYNLALAYSRRHSVCISRHPSEPTWAQTTFPSDPATLGSLLLQTRNAAYEKFKGKISDRAQMAENFVELGKSTEMIIGRSRQVLDMLRALRHGRFGDFAAYSSRYRLFDRSPRAIRKDHRIPTEIASGYLEFHYGLSPLVNDIYSAVNVLQKPINSCAVTAQSIAPILEKTNWPPPPFTGGKFLRGKLVCRYGALISVSNPNLWLANSLGLINPVQLVWELTPLSMVADWFVNVGTFLGTGTDFLGLTLQEPYSTDHYAGFTNIRWGTYGWTSMFTWHDTSRVTGITTPSLTLRPLNVWGWRRAAAAMSLITVGFNAVRGNR